MKNKGLIGAIFGIIIAIFVFLSLLLTSDKSPVFWIGFVFMIISLAYAASTTLLQCSKTGSAFPVQISLITTSFLYVLITGAINILFGSVFTLGYKAFLSVHVVCLAAVVIITLIMVKAKSVGAKQAEDSNSKLCELQTMINEIEIIKASLDNIPASAKRQAVPMINALLDELKFANFSSKVDTTHTDREIHKKIDLLSRETDNLIEIQSDDLTGFSADINGIKELIKARNMNIKLFNNQI